MPGRHALLSPSSSHRWLNCTASARLEAKIPDQPTEYSKEGTLAHAYCARKLKLACGITDVRAEDKEITELQALRTGEMDGYTDDYATFVLERLAEARKRTRDAALMVEKRLDFSSFLPSSFGTADAIIIADGLMEVIDFKYGKGVKVDAEGNSQMRIYALGALAAYDYEFSVREVRMTIFQPRIGNVSSDELSVSELEEWRDVTLVPRAREAAATNGNFKAGDWCTFCKARHACKALADYCADPAKLVKPEQLSNDELAKDILPRLAIIRKWAADVEDYCLTKALAGEDFPGWKVVEGRSVRRITDPAKAAEALEGEGYCDVWKPRELLGITDLEKLCGKKAFAAICGPYVDKPEGKPTLAPESDKRPAFSPARADFAQLGDMDD